MPQIETLARQAWQLKAQGYAIDDIADVMGKPTSAIERWIGRWTDIDQQVPPWHEGLNIHTVHCLRRAGENGTAERCKERRCQGVSVQ
jgi:hypothetical protein